MGLNTRSRVSSERGNWKKIFEGLVKMLRTKHDQLESLVKERKILEDRIKTQHERWVSDVRLFEDHLSQMKKEIDTLEMARLFEIAKSDVLIGLKDREAYLSKLKIEHTEDELGDFKSWFEILTENPNVCQDVPLNEEENDKSVKFKADVPKKLENKIRRLKLQHEKLSLDKTSEVSMLLRENGFVWDQLKRLEIELKDKLKSKDAEIVQANKKILSLVSREEKLLSSNRQKDETLIRLKAKLTDMENDANKKDEEICRLSQELELLQKSRSSPATPVLRRCGKNGKNDNTGENKNNAAAKKERPGEMIPAPVKQIEKGSRSSKRKRVKSRPVSGTPKLFTSNFKVPKLKIQSPKVIQLS